MNDHTQALLRAIGEVLDLPTDSAICQAVSGGDINQAMVLRFGEQLDFFVKYHPGGSRSLFDSELAALQELADTNTVRVPSPMAVGEAAGTPFFVMEHLDLRARSTGSDAVLGRQLASLHRQAKEYFGWARDNFIGSTPQPNPPGKDWTAFFRDHRIGHQLNLLEQKGASASFLNLGRELMERITKLLAGYRSQPALLHGDLWGGNYGALADGTPVVFDPASYYGCRETDLAMTRMFGGFGPDFYRAYEKEYPLSPGHQERNVLYQLYHVLNHANLFGGGYLARAEQMMISLNRL